MYAAQSRNGSTLWRLTRYGSTLSCLVALVAGLLTLAAGHPMHGWLMVLGSLLLVQGSVWGRRSPRHAEHMPMLTEQAEPSSIANRRWRKAS